LDQNFRKKAEKGVLFEVELTVSEAKLWIMDRIGATEKETEIIHDDLLLKFSVFKALEFSIIYNALESLLLIILSVNIDYL